MIDPAFAEASSKAWAQTVSPLARASTIRGTAEPPAPGVVNWMPLSVGTVWILSGTVSRRWRRNLVPFGSAREAAEALASGAVDAWYATGTEIGIQFELIGRRGGAQVGPTLQSAPGWLAVNKDTADLPVDAIRLR